MTLSTTIGIVATAGGFLAGLWIKLIRPFLRKLKTKKAERLKENERAKEDRVKLDHIHKEMMLDGNGSMKTAVVNLQRVTERIEFRLDGIEESQKLALNLQGICYWISNEKGECTYASPALCKLTGRSESEILGNGWVAIVTAEDRQRVLDAWEFSVENQTTFDEIYTIKRADELVLKVWALAIHKTGRKVFGGTIGKLVAIEEPHKPVK